MRKTKKMVEVPRKILVKTEERAKTTTLNGSSDDGEDSSGGGNERADNSSEGKESSNDLGLLCTSHNQQECGCLAEFCYS